MLAVLEHELTMHYHSMKAYVFGAFLLFFTGIGALIYNINASVANFEFVLNFISMIFVVLVPLLTMRTMAEERKQKTDQLLFSLPITTTEIIVGKFLSLSIVFVFPVCFICLYPLLFARFGDVYLPTAYGTILAFFFLGLALMSMGMFISCLTESQSTACGVCVVVMLFNYYCDALANQVSSSVAGAIIGMAALIFLLGLLVRHLTKSDLSGIITGVILTIAVVVAYVIEPDALEGLLPNVMEKLSLFTRFQAFVNGIFDVTALVYYCSVIVFFLFLSVQALEKRRYNG